MSHEEMKSMASACPNFYWKLFQSTFLISAFTVGGGFVIIPLLRAKYVDEYGWLNDKETLNLVSIAQSMPGVVAVYLTGSPRPGVGPQDVALSLIGAVKKNAPGIRHRKTIVRSAVPSS